MERQRRELTATFVAQSQQLELQYKGMVEEAQVAADAARQLAKARQGEVNTARAKQAMLTKALEVWRAKRNPHQSS